MANEAKTLTTGCRRGRSCFVVGSGPSLRGFDFSRLRGHLTIGVNRSFEFFSPTVLLAIDERFFRMVYEGKYGEDALLAMAAYKGAKVGVKISKSHVPGVQEIRGLGVSGPILPIEQGLYHGNNSGYSAVALALALGVETVYVLGIDLRYDNDVTHFHSGHPERTKEIELMRKCLPPFIDLSKRGVGKCVKIVNLNWPRQPFSRLAAHFEVVPFPKESVLQRLLRLVW